ncbi:MAG TPA: hypothetical protein VI895_02165 [Bdellovibrionota bacterium]|nr:hypothetical protein [Bdellovibrionota bacterium]
MALRLGELLVKKKILTAEQVDKALEAQRTYGGRLGTNLVELGFIEDTQLAKVLAEQLRVPSATMEEFENISPDVIRQVSKEFAQEHRVVPIGMTGKLRVAISDPRDVEAIDQLGFKSGKAIQIVVAPEIWIAAALERYYNVARDIRYIRMPEKDSASSGELTYDISTDVQTDYAGKFEPIKSDLSLADYTVRLVRAGKKEEVFDALLDFLGNSFPQMAIYVVRKDHIGGWIVRGFPVHAREFAAVKIPFGTRTIIQTVVDTAAPYVGRLPPTIDDLKSVELLRLPKDGVFSFYPVTFRGRTLTVLLCVAGKGSKAADSGRTAGLACQKAGFALEMLALRNQITQLPAAAAPA